MLNPVSQDARTDHERADHYGADTDELARRLEDRAREALGDRVTHVRWSREPARAPHRIRRERWWPTQSLLDAGTDLLVEEWDPFGICHAGVELEDVAMCAFHFFGCFLAPNGRIDPMTHATEMIASAERDKLALHPSPERHRRYLAARLRDLVDLYPVPPVTQWPPSHLRVIVTGEGGGPPPLTCG